MNKEYFKKNGVQDDMQDNMQVGAQGRSGEPLEGELELINAYTRRALTADEVYVFSLTLCDNDVDRDGERFTVESLFELEKLFVGKTGIIDHNPSAKNQTARIFACRVESADGQKTATGDDYFRLTARAYLPRSEKNSDLILALDSGIIKEVSVGCAVDSVRCSICGEDIGACPHKKGEVYSSKLCCGELCTPYDAYEWSFVAVPAQKRAGVTKSLAHKGEEMNMEKILGAIESKKGFILDDAQSAKLCDYIEKLKECAKDGVFYRESLTGEVLRLSAVAEPQISRETMESIAKSMTIAQLKEVKSAFESRKNEAFAPAVQLYRDKGGEETAQNVQFKI